jgi:hypothetical protein
MLPPNDGKPSSGDDKSLYSRPVQRRVVLLLLWCSTALKRAPKHTGVRLSHRSCQR